MWATHRVICRVIIITEPWFTAQDGITALGTTRYIIPDRGPGVYTRRITPGLAGVLAWVGPVIRFIMVPKPTTRAIAVTMPGTGLEATVRIPDPTSIMAIASNIPAPIKTTIDTKQSLCDPIFIPIPIIMGAMLNTMQNVKICTQDRPNIGRIMSIRIDKAKSIVATRTGIGSAVTRVAGNMPAILIIRTTLLDINHQRKRDRIPTINRSLTM